REIETLFRDAIAAARQWIYIENQYLTSDTVGKALESRLREAHGPEIVMVVSQASLGWLESTAMDVLRARLVKRLCDADHHHRLRVYFPMISADSKDALSVHAKVLVVDNDFVRVGSANVSNRSMGFDTECDLAFESGGQPRIQRVIGDFRNTLMAEHLGTTSGQVAECLTQTQSMIDTIRRLRKKETRRLTLVDCSVPVWLDQMIPESAILDPEAPVAPEKLVDEFVLAEKYGAASGGLLRGLFLVIAVAGLAAAWHWTALRQWVDLHTVAAWATSLSNADTAPLWVVGIFLMAGITCFPVTVLILAMAYTFDPWLAIIYSLMGCTASAMFLYAIGRWLGRKTVGRLAGRRLNRVNRLISKHGMLAVAAARMLPVAPYSLVNLAAGAVTFPFRNFVFGTLLGMSPGVFGITVLEAQLEQTIDRPGLAVLSLLIGTLLLMLLGIFAVRRWFEGKRAPGQLNTAVLERGAESR
ncbi:MAG TPA: VTT domain-containing protein, partial [Terriglobales bacterium]|nr:VTT domain-containing protein [Terriglobales bacterium]